MDWHWQNETDRATMIVYRVSSKKQEDTTSLPYQESQIQSYCMDCKLEIRHSVRLVESAKDAHSRKGYKAAIAYALKHKIKHVIFYMNDRESRNMTDIERNNQYIKAGRIIVHHVHDRRVYWKQSSPNDFFMRNIGASVSQLYVENLSVKVRGGQEGKAKMGWYPYTKLPLGYMWQRDLNAEGREQRRGVAKIISDVNETKLNLIRKEFELRAFGLSMEAIRAKIIELGMEPKTKGIYTAWTIEQRLKNKFYWGYFDYDGEELKGKHPIIIPQEHLDAVAKSFNMRILKQKSDNPEALLAGWIRCGHPECGMILVYDPKTKINPSTGESRLYRYYHCSNSRMIHESQKGMSITEEKILEQFEPIVRNITISSRRAQEILNVIEAEGKEERKEFQQLAANSKKVIADIKAREEKAYEDYLKGVIDGEFFASIKERMKEERQRLQRQMDKSSELDESILMESARKVIELCKNAESLWKEASRQNRVQLVKQLCSNPILKDRTLRFDLENTFSIIGEMSKEQLWWSIGESNS